MPRPSTAFSTRLSDLLATLESAALLGAAGARVRGLGEHLRYACLAMPCDEALVALEMEALGRLTVPAISTAEETRESALSFPASGTPFAYLLAGGTGLAASLEESDVLLAPLRPGLTTEPRSFVLVPLRSAELVLGGALFLRNDEPFGAKELDLAERLAVVLSLTVNVLAPALGGGERRYTGTSFAVPPRDRAGRAPRRPCAVARRRCRQVRTPSPGRRVRRFAEVVMTPLAPLRDISPIAAHLMGASVEEARATLETLRADAPSALVRAAARYAEGSLALRVGALAPAEAAFVEATSLFAAEGETKASELASTEAELARIRRGPRAAYAETRERHEALRDRASSPRVAAVAAHYAGTAARFAGDALAAQRLLLDAFARSDGLAAERAQILNSLGTLYVVLGAVGAAEALLEHAAELHQRSGNRVGEAISHGQIGATALARGDRARAKRALQRQEWLASQVGDAFGQALVEHLDVASVAQRGLALAASTLSSAPEITLTRDAEALAVLAGLVVVRE